MSTKSVTSYTKNTKMMTYKDTSLRRKFAAAVGVIAGSVAIVITAIVVVLSQVDTKVPIY